MTTFVATWLWTQSCPIIHSQPHVFCVFLEGFVVPRPAVCLLCSVTECMNCLMVTAGLRCNLKPDPVCAGGGARSEVSMMFPWQNPHQFTADPSEIKFGLDSGDTLRFLSPDWSLVGCLSACSWPMRSCLLSWGGAPDSGNWRPSCSQLTPSKSCPRTCGGGCRYAHTCTHRGHYCWMKH